MGQGRESSQYQGGVTGTTAEGLPAAIGQERTIRLSSHRTAAILSLLASASVGAAHAQDYPTRPVRIVTATPGGGNDYLARIIAPALGAALGQQVIADNRASRLVGGIVARATPDGYTLVVGGGTMQFVPLMEKADYDLLSECEGAYGRGRLRRHDRNAGTACGETEVRRRADEQALQAHRPLARQVMPVATVAETQADTSSSEPEVNKRQRQEVRAVAGGSRSAGIRTGVQRAKHRASTGSA